MKQCVAAAVEALEGRALLSVSIIASRAHASELNGSTSGRGQFTFTRTDSTAQPLTVSFTVAPNSTAATSQYAPLPSQVTIPAGKKSVTLAVNPIDDGIPRPTEALTLALSNSASYQINPKHSTATVFIADAHPTVSITATRPRASEKLPTTRGLGQFTFTRAGSKSGNLTVNYLVDSASTAVAGYDFNPATLGGSIVIPSGKSSVTLDITPISDHLLEPTRSMTLDLNSGAYFMASKKASATVTIADDGSSTTPRGAIVSIVTLANASESNPAAPGQFQVSRLGSTAAATTVQYSVTGTAVAGTDYTALSGSVTIPAGARTATIDVSPLGSDLPAPATVVVTLTNSGQSSAAQKTATVTLSPSGSPIPTGTQVIDVAVASNASQANGGTAGQFAVTIPQALSSDLTVQYTVGGSAVAGTDYTALSGSVVIPAGQTRAIVTVTPTNPAASASKTVQLTLVGSGETNAALTTATLTIATASTPATPAGWFDTSYHQRLPISIATGSTARTDAPIDYAVNFTQALAGVGKSGTLNDQSIRVVETTADGSQVINANVPFQFDKAQNYDPATNAAGDLVFLLTGTTAANTTRYYHVYYDTGTGFTAPSVTPLVTTTDNVTDAGQTAVQIATPTATYFLQKANGGFSSIIDKSGNNWLGFNPTPGSGSAGEYRGLPNAIVGGGFHAGFTSGSTQIVSTGPLKTTLISTVQVNTTGSGLETYTMKYEIYPTFVRATMMRADAQYWFLYEGTPGGTINDNDYIVRSDGTQTNINTSFTANTGIGAANSQDWAYFESVAANRYLFMVDNQPDNSVDSYYLMDHAMTVFGFGRDNSQSGANRELLTGQNSFTFGLADGGSDFTSASTQINGTYQPISQTTGTGQSIA